MKNKKLIIGIAIVAIALFFIGFLMVNNFMMTNYDVSAFLSKQNSLTNKTVRVGGQVMPGVQHDVSLSTLTFTITDKTDVSKSLSVVYRGGSIPDAFKEGQDVIVEGKYSGSGPFLATSLITKCPSKYTVAPANTSK